MTNHHVIKGVMEKQFETNSIITAISSHEKIHPIEYPLANIKDLYNNPKPITYLIEKLATVVTVFLVFPKYDVAFLGPIRGNEHLVPVQISSSPLEGYFTPELPIFTWGSPHGYGPVPLSGFACKEGFCFGGKVSERIFFDITAEGGHSGGPILSTKDGALIGIIRGSLPRFRESFGNEIYTGNLNDGIPIRSFWDSFVKEYDTRKQQAEAAAAKFAGSK